MEPTKPCPKCGQQILAAAIKCKHCKSRLDEAGAAPAAVQTTAAEPPPLRPATPAKPAKKKSALRLVVIIVVALVIGGGGLTAAFFLIWRGETSTPDSVELPKSTPSPAAAARRKRRAKRRAKLRRLEQMIETTFTARDCGEMPIDQGLCEALGTAVETGRTTPKGRRDLRKHLKDRGYFRLRGYIVGKIGRGLYEIYRYGRRYHALLKTTLTEYRSKGRFNLWAKKIGTGGSRRARGAPRDQRHEPRQCYPDRRVSRARRKPSAVTRARG
jgi:hypothetical protein